MELGHRILKNQTLPRRAYKSVDRAVQRKYQPLQLLLLKFYLRESLLRLDFVRKDNVIKDLFFREFSLNLCTRNL